MTAFRLINAVTLTVLTAVTVLGEEPAVELPPEGAWVRYHEVTKIDNGREFTRKVTMKFLGRQEWNGQPCRWIEVQDQDDSNTQELTYAAQLLIPEKALRESERPVDQVVKLLYRDGKGEIVSESTELAGEWGIDLLFLSAARKNARSIEEEQKVEFQSGRLTIPLAYQGEYIWDRGANSLKKTWDYSVWLHPDVPVGVARARFVKRIARDGVTVRTYKIDRYLEAYGLDAKPAFAK